MKYTDLNLKYTEFKITLSLCLYWRSQENYYCNGFEIL